MWCAEAGDHQAGECGAVRRPVGELDRRRGYCGSLPRAPLAYQRQARRAASDSVSLRFATVAHSRHSRGRWIRTHNARSVTETAVKRPNHASAPRTARAKRIAVSGDRSGPRVVTGKSAARIPAPERHDRPTAAATSEREVGSLRHHGSTRARHPGAQWPHVKAFASTGSEGVAVGPHGSRFAVIARPRQ